MSHYSDGNHDSRTDADMKVEKIHIVKLRTVKLAEARRTIYKLPQDY